MSEKEELDAIISNFRELKDLFEFPYNFKQEETKGDKLATNQRLSYVETLTKVLHSQQKHEA